MPLLGTHGKITIVSKPDCKYCGFAKDDLAARGLEFTESAWSELSGTESETELRAMVKPKPLTFPQIFIGTERVQLGYQGLYDLMQDHEAFAACLARNGVRRPKLELLSDGF